MEQWLTIALKKENMIALTNLKYCCFPKQSENFYQLLCKQSFQSIGMGLLESCIAWFMPDERFTQIPVDIIGRGTSRLLPWGKQGIILLGSHFTTLEIAGRYFVTTFGKTHPLFINPTKRSGCLINGYGIRKT